VPSPRFEINSNNIYDVHLQQFLEGIGGQLR
jgi:hypothetical protein